MLLDRPQRKITVLTRTHKTKLHVSRMVFVTGIRRLLVKNMWRTAFPLQNHCQGQSQFDYTTFVTNVMMLTVQGVHAKAAVRTCEK